LVIEGLLVGVSGLIWLLYAQIAIAEIRYPQIQA
jgi:hypothetical protein